MRNPRTPISSSEKATLDHLAQYIETTVDDERLTRDDAVAYLMNHGIKRPDARDHIRQLLLKGYLYEVDGELHIPRRS